MFFLQIRRKSRLHLSVCPQFEQKGSEVSPRLQYCGRLQGEEVDQAGRCQTPRSQRELGLPQVLPADRRGGQAGVHAARWSPHRPLRDRGIQEDHQQVIQDFIK